MSGRRPDENRRFEPRRPGGVPRSGPVLEIAETSGDRRRRLQLNPGGASGIGGPRGRSPWGLPICLVAARSRRSHQRPPRLRLRGRRTGLGQGGAADGRGLSRGPGRPRAREPCGRTRAAEGRRCRARRSVWVRCSGIGKLLGTHGGSRARLRWSGPIHYSDMGRQLPAPVHFSAISKRSTTSSPLAFTTTKIWNLPQSLLPSPLATLTMVDSITSP